MPIPFLIGAGALLVGGLGVAGGLAAKETMDEAKKLGEKGDRLIKDAARRLDDANTETNETIEELANTKLDILSNNINTFTSLYKTLRNVKSNNSIGLDELSDFMPQSDQIKMLERASFTALDLSKGYGGGLASGGLTAIGAYGTVGLLGTASTGTAIGTLSGAAATNATLAWLGGGSLATGGLGIAGGTAVLGGIVAAPALLVGAYFLNNKADEAMSKAKTHYAKAEKYEADCNYRISLYDAQRERAEDIIDALLRLDERLDSQIPYMQDIIRRKGVDWRSFSVDELKVIAATAMTAKTLKLVMDTPLRREDETLNPATEMIYDLEIW